MPLYMLVRPSKKGRVKETRGFRDHMRSKRTQANPTALQGAIPCYTVEAPQEFDEPGKELSPDAQVWKTYVREADQVDEELVDGWNKSMDVILIFAALFSAISTAFVIESYKNLKQDPADLSSETLVTISKTLAFIANGSQPSTAPPASEPEAAQFKASAKAICVNILWFLSLSLSVAVSLISMLAKEWCLEFMAGRTGLAGAQARRRQQRWDGLVGWKMKEVIVILPSLIHLSLLLFAIGLCVFLWDVHYGVAIPVVVVTTLAVGAYFACTILPFLYDYCPYGTVLSRLYKQLSMVRSQTIQDGVKQDEVTAKALQWMIVNCETPRSVDVALQSLAAAEETLPPKPLDECSTWAMIKQRAEYPDPQGQLESNPTIITLYERALKALPIVKRGADQLDYGTKPETRRLEELVLSIQCVIDSAIHQITMTKPSPDPNTSRILQQCTLIGRSYLSRKDVVPTRKGFNRYDKPDLGFLARHIVEFLERLPREKLNLAVYNILSASFAFAMCCTTPRDSEEDPIWYTYVGPVDPTDLSEKTRPINRAIGALWMLISSDHSSHTNQLARNPYTSIETALDVLWACTMSTIGTNETALKQLDITYLVHGLFRLHIDSHRLDPGPRKLVRNTRYLISNIVSIFSGFGRSRKIQGSYHAQYMEEITHNMVAVTDAGGDTYVLLGALWHLAECSPWEQKCLLLTPEVYASLFEMTLGDRHWELAKYGLDCCPFPKPSPRLAGQLLTETIISQLYNYIDGEPDGSKKKAIAMAQLWLLFDMFLRIAERTSPVPSDLETALLGYPGLENDLNKREEVMEDLEIKLLNQIQIIKGRNNETKYLDRVFELILQRRCSPLPKEISDGLKHVPQCLRGLTSFVDLETERSIAYPDVQFDSKGWKIQAPKEERIVKDEDFLPKMESYCPLSMSASHTFPV